MEVVAVSSGGEALAVAKQKYLDGITVGMDITDIPPVQLVEEIQEATGRLNRRIGKQDKIHNENRNFSSKH